MSLILYYSQHCSQCRVSHTARSEDLCEGVFIVIVQMYVPVSVQEGIEHAAIAPAGGEVDAANARVALGGLLSP